MEKLIPTTGTVSVAWRLLRLRRSGLLRDVALWLRAPAGRRPHWAER